MVLFALLGVLVQNRFVGGAAAPAKDGKAADEKTPLLKEDAPPADKMVGPARYCWPRHRMPFFFLVLARHVIGCRSTQETRVPHALRDVASNVCVALSHGGALSALPRSPGTSPLCNVTGGSALAPSLAPWQCRRRGMCHAA
jgi:hypothetical protein